MRRSSPGAGHHPVVYAGRFADRISSLPGGCEVLGEREEHPRTAAAIERATTLVLLDPGSFPFEVMSEDQWDVPLIVLLPSELDAEALITEFGASLFEHLGFFDRLVTPNPEVWRTLRERYRWAESQRIETSLADSVKLISSLCASRDASGHWSARYSKAVYRTRARALGQRLVLAKGNHPGEAPLEVLGVGDGMWAALPDLAETRFRGAGIHEDAVSSARRDFPEFGFEGPGSDLRLPYEDRSLDLVFGVDVFQDESPPVRKTLLSEMWRVARSGGSLLFVEDFVFERTAERHDPMPVSRFMKLILEATGYRVVLDHVESLRYPGEDLFRGGVISLLRLGTTVG